MIDISQYGPLKKIYVLDTSVFIHHPLCVDVLGDSGNLVDIPFPLIEQLDHLKTRSDLKGAAAREASREIKKYRKKARQEGQSLKFGTQTKGGGWVRISYLDEKDSALKNLPFHYNDSADKNIIAIAWQRSNDASLQDTPTILVSNDTNMLITADALDVQAEDYEHDSVITSLSELYTGIRDIPLNFVDKDFSSQFHRNSFVSAKTVFDSMGSLDLFPNECCRFINPSNGKVTALAIYKKSKGMFKSIELPSKRKDTGIVPLNDEQAFAEGLLLDPDISMVTFVGPAGAGKTLLSIYHGCKQALTGSSTFQQVLAFRPIVEMGGRSLGFYKGTLEEKIGPWTEAILDNFEVIEHALRKDAKTLMREGMLKMAPLIHTRGRSLHNKFIYVDDAQNITPHECKTVVTRMAAGSKIVFSGDPAQIDDPFLTPISNGLVYAIQRLKGQEGFGHICLKESERHPFVNIAAKLL